MKKLNLRQNTVSYPEIQAMKVNQKPGVYLQIINVLSFLVILITVIYTGVIVNHFPDNLNFSSGFSLPDNTGLDKGKVWEDIRLMVTAYLVISILSIYLQLLPHGRGNGKSKAIVVSLLNLCIALVFSITIIGGILHIEK